MLKVALLTHDNRGGGAPRCISSCKGLTLISSNHRIANTLLLSELENRDHQISKLKIATTFNNHSLDILISTLLSRVWSRLHNVQSDPRYFYMSGYKNTSGFCTIMMSLIWLQNLHYVMFLISISLLLLSSRCVVSHRWMFLQL